MLAGTLDGLRARGDDAVFVGADRISGAEFADLVWAYAGGLRARQERSIALVGRPGPTILAAALAAFGTGTRVDLIDPFAGEDLVRLRLEASSARVTVAEGGIAWPLKGPKWLRDRMGLPKYDVWPEIVSVDHLGGAQQRRFALEPDAGALTLFRAGQHDEPLGVVHSVASLSAALSATALLLEGEGPILTDSLVVMLAAVGLGRQIVRAAPRNRLLARQLRRRRPSHTVVRTWPRLAGLQMRGTVIVGGGEPASVEAVRALKGAGAQRVLNVYALPELFPVAASESDDEGLDLVEGVEAHVAADDELRLRGPAMAPRFVEGPYLEDVATGRRARLEGRRLHLSARA